MSSIQEKDRWKSKTLMIVTMVVLLLVITAGLLLPRLYSPKPGPKYSPAEKTPTKIETPIDTEKETNPEQTNNKEFTREELESIKRELKNQIPLIETKEVIYPVSNINPSLKNNDNSLVGQLKGSQYEELYN